jgi:hypothetical protein
MIYHDGAGSTLFPTMAKWALTAANQGTQYSSWCIHSTFSGVSVICLGGAKSSNRNLKADDPRITEHRAEQTGTNILKQHGETAGVEET